MKKCILVLLSGCALLASCAKDVNTVDPHAKISPTGAMKRLPVKQGFAWSTLKGESIRLNIPSSVYAVNGEEKILLAENLPAGTYNFTRPLAGAALEAEQLASPLSSLKTRTASANLSVAYFPSADASQWGMMMVEDIFPYLSDLDMNDVIFDFRIKYEIDASKPVAQTESPFVKAIEFTIKPVALGGSIYDMIGVALNLVGTAAASVVDVSGQELTNSMFDSEDESIIPLTDDFVALFEGKGMMNTYNNLPQVTTKTFTVRAELRDVRLRDLQLVENDGKMLDLFVTLGERGREVHLKGHPATSKLNDNLKPYASYSDKDANWVWAMILPGRIKYPKEGSPIYYAYPIFTDWVKGDMVNTEEWSYAPQADKIYISQ